MQMGAKLLLRGARLDKHSRMCQRHLTAQGNRRFLHECNALENHAQPSGAVGTSQQMDTILFSRGAALMKSTHNSELPTAPNCRMDTTSFFKSVTHLTTTRDLEAPAVAHPPNTISFVDVAAMDRIVLWKPTSRSQLPTNQRTFQQRN